MLSMACDIDNTLFKLGEVKLLSLNWVGGECTLIVISYFSTSQPGYRGAEHPLFTPWDVLSVLIHLPTRPQIFGTADHPRYCAWGGP